MAKQKAFSPKDVQRNRALGWDAAEKKAVLTSDLMLEDGETVDVAKCETLKINPKSVAYLTTGDLPPAYSENWKTALTAHAAATGYPANDLTWKLVIADAMQDAANKSVAEFRPITDKAMERASSTMVRTTGKSRAEVARLVGILK